MTAQHIAYLELYVCDPGEAIEYFTTGFGLLPVAAAGPGTGLLDRTSTVLRGGSVQLVITAPSTPASPVAEYLEEHGEGVVDIAFGCDDVRTAYTRAVNAGATALREPVIGAHGGPEAAVGAFGAVRHTLVPAGTGLPPGRWHMLHSPDVSATTVRSLDHVAICLEAGTLRSTAAFYERAFGLDFYSSEYIAVGEQAMDSIVVRSPSQDITFTMIEPDPTREPGQIDGFLAANRGAGVQHLAFLVADIVTAVRAIGDRGVDFLHTPEAYYDALAARAGDLADRVADLRSVGVLADQDEWGYLLQIFSRSPYPRRSLFFELVQRNEARGFGSANIRALYEAVERQQAAAV